MSARAGSPGPDIEPALVALHPGVPDDHLAQIAQVVNSRPRAIDAVEEPMAKAACASGTGSASTTTSGLSTCTAEVRPSSPGTERSG